LGEPAAVTGTRYEQLTRRQTRIVKTELVIMVVKTVVYSDIEVRNRPSFYAAPVAWAAATFAQLLVGDEGGIDPDRTGLIIVSDECSLTAIRNLSRTAAQGTMSPLRFAGASPSMVAGLPALEQGIRGPTLCLTMSPAHAAGAIIALSDYWFRYSDIASVVMITHFDQGKRRQLFKGLIARSVDDELRKAVLQLVESRV
jgi:hypothetical protein